MHESLVKFALLLQDRGQIRMRSGELWKHFQSFQIQGGSLLNKALFTFDIRQIIERIRMIWTQPEKAKKKKHVLENGEKFYRKRTIYVKKTKDYS